MVIPFVVPEILGGVEPPPQMPLSCQKRQMPLTVKTKIFFKFWLSFFFPFPNFNFMQKIRNTDEHFSQITKTVLEIGMFQYVLEVSNIIQKGSFSNFAIDILFDVDFQVLEQD